MPSAFRRVWLSRMPYSPARLVSTMTTMSAHGPPLTTYSSNRRCPLTRAEVGGSSGSVAVKNFRRRAWIVPRFERLVHEPKAHEPLEAHVIADVQQHALTGLREILPDRQREAGRLHLLESVHQHLRHRRLRQPSAGQICPVAHRPDPARILIGLRPPALVALELGRRLLEEWRHRGTDTPK